MLLNIQIEKNAKTYADMDLFLIVNEKYLKDIGVSSLRALRKQKNYKLFLEIAAALGSKTVPYEKYEQIKVFMCGLCRCVVTVNPEKLTKRHIYQINEGQITQGIFEGYVRQIRPNPMNPSEYLYIKIGYSRKFEMIKTPILHGYGLVGESNIFGNKTPQIIEEGIFKMNQLINREPVTSLMSNHPDYATQQVEE